MRQKRSFLSPAATDPQTLKILVPQTLGETRFDFVTFLSPARRADDGAGCSIGDIGLYADLRGSAASVEKRHDGLIKDGPKLPSDH